MTKVTVDDELRARLNGLNDQLELCDEAGRTIGLFLPEEAYWKMMLKYDQCPYSYEDLQRFRQEKGGRSLSEIWKSLGRQ